LFWGQLPGRCKLFVSKALINQIFHVQNGIRTARNVWNHVLPRPGCAPDVALPNAAALLVVNASVVAEHIDPTIPFECQTTVLDKKSSELGIVGLQRPQRPSKYHVYIC